MHLRLLGCMGYLRSIRTMFFGWAPSLLFNSYHEIEPTHWQMQAPHQKVSAKSVGGRSELKLEREGILVSFDIVSLTTSVPVIETLLLECVVNLYKRPIFLSIYNQVFMNLHYIIYKYMNDAQHIVALK